MPEGQFLRLGHMLACMEYHMFHEAHPLLGPCYYVHVHVPSGGVSLAPC